MKLGKKTLIPLLIVLCGSFFIGITTVQATVQKLPFETVALWDYTGFYPGTTIITGNWAAHIIDNVNTFVFIEGPVEGISVSTSIITNFNDKTGKGEGIAFTETTGTWIADDEFNGLPFYCYGRSILRKAFDGFGYIGTVNWIGTLGDYSIQIRGEAITIFDFATYLTFNYISGEIKIIS
jgi:hypothetical protein